jgi:hypothetical protein
MEQRPKIQARDLYLQDNPIHFKILTTVNQLLTVFVKPTTYYQQRYEQIFISPEYFLLFSTLLFLQQQSVAGINHYFSLFF